MTHPPARAMLRQFLERGVLDTLAPHLGSPDARFRILLAGSHLMGLFMMRRVVGVDALRDVDLDYLVAVVAPTIDRYLTGDLGGVPGTGQPRTGAPPRRPVISAPYGTPADQVRPPPPGLRGRRDGGRLGAHPARLQGGLLLPGDQRRVLPGLPAGDRRRRACPTTRRRCCASPPGPPSPSPATWSRRPARASRWSCGPARSRCTAYADPEAYPIQKKQITYERLREIAHLRPRTNTFGAVARVRNALAFATHRFFQERDFLYLHAPVITASDAEGAGQMFRVTTLDPAAPPRDARGAVDWSEDFFGRPTFLTVSGQLEAETYACALDRVYTFGPTFRAENSNTRRHLAEFWMIEPEMAFADLADDAALAEDCVRYLCRYVLDHCPEDLAFFEQRVQPGLVAMLEGVAGTAFHRLTYTEAVAVLAEGRRLLRVPGGLGQRTAVGARALPDRDRVRPPGRGHRLPLRHQGLLHAPQRRRAHRGRHGRAGPRHRGDRRGQPARGAPRRAPRQRGAARASTSTSTGGTPTSAATAPSPMPGSASASSAWCSSAPGCRTSATSSPTPGHRAAPTSSLHGLRLRRSPATSPRHAEVPRTGVRGTSTRLWLRRSAGEDHLGVCSCCRPRS